MESLLKKLDEYDIMVNLLPGSFFGLLIEFLLHIEIPEKNIFEKAIIYYFVGLIINRIGSIMVRPILKRIKFIEETPYSEYIKAEKCDEKVRILSNVNNYFRTLFTSCLLLPVIWILHKLILHWSWFSLNWKGCLIVFLIILFSMAYRKQTDYVRLRVEDVNNQNMNSKNN